MDRIIAIANQKGGVGKSTTAINLSACLAEKGKKVLTIDMDPQGNTTSGLGVDKESLENTVYELILGESGVNDCIINLSIENLSIIPSNVNLAGAEIELIGMEEKEYILKKAIDQIKDSYDFILIDCPPSLNLLTINAMTTAKSVLVPSNVSLHVTALLLSAAFFVVSEPQPAIAKVAHAIATNNNFFDFLNFWNIVSPFF